MRTYIKAFAVSCLCFAIAAPSFADVIFLNAGEEFSGKLISVKNKQIIFEDLNKNQKVFNEDDVASVLISKIRQGDEITSVNAVKDPIALKALNTAIDPVEFKDSDYITLYRNNTYEYLNENEVICRTREIKRIMKEQGIDEGNNSFYYYIERESPELVYAHTYSADGKVYHITDDALSDEALRSSTPEYNKIKKLKAAFKKVDVGSVIDYSFVSKQTKINETSAYVVDYIFGETEPVLHEELNIIFPSTMNLKKETAQWDKNIPEFKEEKTKDKTIWKWTYSDRKGFVAEQNMMPLSRIFPRLVVYKEYERTIIDKALSDGYKKAAPKKELLDKFIKKLGLSSANTDYEKVCKIYSAVNKEIRDVSMGIGSMGSHLPISADVTLTKGYANTQGMLALMYYACKSLNIEAYPGFADTKRERMTFKDHANLEFARIPILKIVIDGFPYYSDGGSSYLPFGYISTSMQGSEAYFIDVDKSEGFFDRLPVQTFNWNRKETIINVKVLEDGTMKVSQTVMPRGPYEASFRKLKSLKEKEKRNYAEKMVKNVHPHAVLDGYCFANLDNLDVPVVMSLSYTIDKAAQRVSDDLLTFTNFWAGYGSSSASLKKRKFPMKYWATEESVKTVVYELPDGFEWVRWDKQFVHNSPEFSFSSLMSSEGNKLVYTDKFTALTEELLTDKSYQNYRKCLLDMAELGNQWIIIERKPNKTN